MAVDEQAQFPAATVPLPITPVASAVANKANKRAVTSQTEPQVSLRRKPRREAGEGGRKPRILNCKYCSRDTEQERKALARKHEEELGAFHTRRQTTDSSAATADNSKSSAGTTARYYRDCPDSVAQDADPPAQDVPGRLTPLVVSIGCLSQQV